MSQCTTRETVRNTPALVFDVLWYQMVLVYEDYMNVPYIEHIFLFIHGAISRLSVDMQCIYVTQQCPKTFA